MAGFDSAGTVAPLLTRDLAPKRVRAAGCLALVAGTGLSLLAPTGVGWAGSVLGPFGALSALAGVQVGCRHEGEGIGAA
jgi:hypothetical protein